MHTVGRMIKTKQNKETKNSKIDKRATLAIGQIPALIELFGVSKINTIYMISTIQPYSISPLLLYTLTGSYISKLVLSVGSVSYTPVPPAQLISDDDAEIST